MSNTLAGLRHKISGARQLGAVVRAMKAVAASSIGQYAAAVEALDHYQRSVELGLSLCLRERGLDAAAPAPAPAPTAARPAAQPRHVGVLIFGSDQGLVGRFNEVIGDFALAALQTLPGPKTIWGVGERVCAHLQAAGLPVARRFPVPGSVAAITTLVTHVQLELEEYATRELRGPADGGPGAAGSPHGEVHVFHNRPLPPARYAAAGRRLLPLDAAWRRRLTAMRWPTARLPEVLGGAAAGLPGLVHEHLFIHLYKACAESLASENASRLEAMERAEKNIDSVSSELRLRLNRLRQSSIDEELFDVVAGFNALSGTPHA